jgi:hypothetical protein
MNWSYVRNIFFLFFLAFVGLFVLVSIHEYEHVVIFDKFGCSHSVYFTLIGARTAGLCSTSIDIVSFDAMNQVVDDSGWLYVGVASSVWAVLVFFFFRFKDWV